MRKVHGPFPWRKLPCNVSFLRGRHTRRTALLASLLCTLGLSLSTASCSGPAAAVGLEEGTQSLVIEAPRSKLQVGESVVLIVKFRDGAGKRVPNGHVTWKSLNPSVAALDGDGSDSRKLTAHHEGTAAITVASGDLNGSATFVVGTEVSQTASMPAFLGAEGFGAGALSVCRSRPLNVIKVTTLASDGSGSLREAVEERIRSAQFNIIVFAVGGLIDLERPITIRADCLYIAGHSAPGSGITLRGRGGNNSQSIFVVKNRYSNVPTSDLVVRYVRLASGWSPELSGEEHPGGNLIVYSCNYCVFDHISSRRNPKYLYYFVDTAIQSSSPITDVSLQWSIAAETLADHPTAIHVSGQPKEGYLLDGWIGMQRFSVHHNFISTTGYRNPHVTGMDHEVINNVVYNWEQGAGHTTRGSRVDFVNQFWKPGPLTKSANLYEVTYRCDTDDEMGWDGVNGRAPSIYATGGTGPHNLSDPDNDMWTDPNRQVACHKRTGDSGEPGEALPQSYRRNRRIDAQAPFPVTIQDAFSARDVVLAEAGASRRLDCAGDWVDARDVLDQKNVEEFFSGSGLHSLPHASEGGFGAWPGVPQPGTACSDSDEDGLPDVWEEAISGDATLAKPDGDWDGDGYLNIEDYLNGKG